MGTILLPGVVLDTPDARARLLDESDPVEQVGYDGIPPNAPVAQVAQCQALGQAAGAAYLDPVRVDLDEDVGAVKEPVPVHDCIGDGLAQGLHRILRNILPTESFNTVGRTGIALDESQGVLDVGHDPTGEVLAVQDVDLVRAFRQQAGDVRFRKEAPHVPGEEEHAGVSKKQPVTCPLGYVHVDQHVFDRRTPANAGLAEPDVELLVIEIFRILEAGTG